MLLLLVLILHFFKAILLNSVSIANIHSAMYAQLHLLLMLSLHPQALQTRNSELSFERTLVQHATQAHKEYVFHQGAKQVLVCPVFLFWTCYLR